MSKLIFTPVAALLVTLVGAPLSPAHAQWGTAAPNDTPLHFGMKADEARREPGGVRRHAVALDHDHTLDAQPRQVERGGGPDDPRADDDGVGALRYRCDPRYSAVSAR